MMTWLLALMNSTVECLVAHLFTAELATACDLARGILHLLAAVASYRHTDVARWTGSWMTGDLAVFVLAVLILWSLAVLAT